MPQIDLLSITARRAAVLSLVCKLQTQNQIAVALQVSPATVKSHIEWLREATKLNSMRELGDWWPHARKDWLFELAEAAGLEVGVEHSFTGKGTEPIKMGPMGGLTQ